MAAACGANSGQASSAATSVMLTITPASPIAPRAAWAQKKPPVSVAPIASAKSSGVDVHRVGRDEPAGGRVHEHVEAAERGRCLLDGAPRGAAVGQVGGEAVPARALDRQRRGRLGGVGGGVVVGERDLRAALGQAERDRASDAAGASRHEHAGARDVHGVSRPRA